MGRVCKRLKDTKANLKNECVKSDYTRYLDPVAVMGFGDVNVLVPGEFADVGKKGKDVMDFEGSEDRVIVEKKMNDQIHALYSPVMLLNAVPSLNQLSKIPKTPCKRQANNLMDTPKTPCTQGRLSSSPQACANLMRTPKTPCSRSRFQSSLSAFNNLLKTPKTPCSQESISDSRLESLPIDLLVKVLCHLHHDQLKPAFHVSKRVREAVQLARQYHFNFITPDRSRQALLNTTTPQPWEHWPFINDSSLNRNRNSKLKPCPRTPKAPRHSSRPPPKFDSTDVCPIDDALFQESAFPSRCLSSSSLTRSISKSQLASNRVLFYSNDSNCCNSLL